MRSFRFLLGAPAPGPAELAAPPPSPAPAPPGGAPAASAPSKIDRAAQAAGDFAVTAWLWFAISRFGHARGPDWPALLLGAAGVAALAALWRLEPPRLHRPGPAARRWAGFGVCLFAAGLAFRQLHWTGGTPAGDLWFALAAGALIAGMRRVAQRAGRFDRGELARWVLIGLAGFGAMGPFYTSEMIGAGDAQWYTQMLADATTQLRAGVFPLWVGQSLYAFNGAVMPVRYAPGYLYFGGAVDLLTGQVLHPTALKNLVLALAAILGAASAYACLVRIIPTRRWWAGLLAIAWVFGPGVLAPALVGDQYMTFLTLPFVPVALYGCWRMVTDDSCAGPFLAAAGLAAAWLCHPPVAFWTTLVTLGLGGYGLWSLPGRRGRRALAFGATFAVLGSYPFVSVFTLENRLVERPSGLVVAQQVEAAFPANVKPLDPERPGLGSYQLGYYLVGLWLATGAAAGATRGRGFRPLLVAAAALIPITLPVPGLTRLLWGHAPDWLLLLNNVWPMQRLFLIWSALIVFAAAAVLRCRPAASGRMGTAAAVALLALAWPAREAVQLETVIARTRSPAGSARLLEHPDDAVLSRYAYGAFAFTPAYASHGFADAWLENRLVDRATQTPLLTNADAAAPASPAAALPGVQTRLVAAGGFLAKNIPSSDYYELLPHLTLEPGRHYALRVAFSPPGIVGTFQIYDADIFREYLLPDSGSGMMRHGPSRSFGAEAQSGHVISLTSQGTGPHSPLGLLITVRPQRTDFAAGQFSLFDYDRASLPVAVDGWIPYRARVSAPAAAYLETPRVWLDGWRATVDGRPVATRRSAQNLVMVPVAKGKSVVELRYQPSWLLRLSFGLALVGWAGVAALAVRRGAPGRPGPRPPETPPPHQFDCLPRRREAPI